jgi:DNA-binding transcriptional MerR regulator
MKKLSIGEVAKILGVAGHTIRFWTAEFPEYIPFEIGKGERRYYPETALPVFQKINHLIHSEGIKIRVIKEKKLLLSSNIQTNSGKLTEIKTLLQDALTALQKI